MTRLGLAAMAGLLVGAIASSAGAQTDSDLVARTELRVCADPNNLPFSNQQQQGFENRIAALVARDLHEPVSYVWFPQGVGFVRNTLDANRCDVVMGTVAGGDMMDDTNPYYHSGYMVVARQTDGITATSLADPVFADKRIGLIAATPPTDLLLRHHLMAHVTSYSLAIDTRYHSPARQMLQDIVDRKIDVGLLWGPFAGYFISHEHLPLTAAFLQSEPDAARLDYRIAMGVRPGDTGWRRTLNGIIRTHQDEITQILMEYGIPLLDEQNRPIPEPPPK
jgi:quinoprotein dehydrogenase-associated probable ABC transporter substrate-binding protein